jgi:hypothetical protein
MTKGKPKTVKFTPEGVEKLPKDKPVVYKILNDKGENIYTGVAKRGRVEERLKEHLPSGPDPIPGGVKVKIQPKQTIAEAEKSEKIIISRSKPKHNKLGT